MFLGLNIQAWIAVMAIIMMLGLTLITRLSAGGRLLSGLATLLMFSILTSEVVEGVTLLHIVEKGILLVVIAGLIHTATIKVLAYRAQGPPTFQRLDNKQLSSLVVSLKLALGNTARFFASILKGQIPCEKSRSEYNKDQKSISYEAKPESVKVQKTDSGIGDSNSSKSLKILGIVALTGAPITGLTTAILLCTSILGEDRILTDILTKDAISGLTFIGFITFIAGLVLSYRSRIGHLLLSSESELANENNVGKLNNTIGFLSSKRCLPNISFGNLAVAWILVITMALMLCSTFQLDSVIRHESLIIPEILSKTIKIGMLSLVTAFVLCLRTRIGHLFPCCLHSDSGLAKDSYELPVSTLNYKVRFFGVSIGPNRYSFHSWKASQISSDWGVSNSRIGDGCEDIRDFCQKFLRSLFSSYSSSQNRLRLQ